MEKRKQLTRKEALALGGAALAAFAAGGVATHTANANADSTQPQGTVKTGSPAVQTAQEQAAQHAGQNQTPVTPRATTPTAGQQTGTTTGQQTGAAAQGTHTAGQSTTGRTTAGTTAGQTGTNTQTQGSRAQQTASTTTPARTQQPSGQQGTATGSTNGQATGQTTGYHAPQYHAPQTTHVTGNTGNQTGVQPSTARTGQQSTVTPSAQSRAQGQGVNAKGQGNASFKNPMNSRMARHAADVQAANQIKRTHANDLAKINANRNQNTKQNPVVPSRKNNGSVNTKNTNKGNNQKKGMSPADQHAASMDKYHPIFNIGPSKQQQKDANADLDDARTTYIDNLFDEGQNAAAQKVSSKDYKPIIENGIKAIENAQNSQDVHKAQEATMKSLYSLERQQSLDNIMSQKPTDNSFDDPTNDPTPVMPTNDSRHTIGADEPSGSNVNPVSGNTVVTPNTASFNLSADGKTLTIGNNVIPNDHITNGIAQGINADHQFDNVTNLNLNSSKIIGDGQNLFAGMPSLQTVTGNADATQADDFDGMFADDPQLDDITGLQNWTLPSSNFDLYGMFENDPQLSNIQPLSRWDASHIDSVGKMFSGDSSLHDWTPIEDNWKFDGDPEVDGMFNGSPANNSLDPTYRQVGNNQTQLDAGDPNAASNYIVGDSASNVPADHQNAAGQLGTSAASSASSNDTGLARANSTASNASGSAAKNSATSSNADDVTDAVLYHDQSGKVIASRNVSRPDNSILNVGPKSEFEKENMPKGYHYDDPKAPTQYAMTKGMLPIEIGVAANSAKQNAEQAKNGNDKYNKDKSGRPVNAYGQPISETNGASWQHGAVTEGQVANPVNIEPAGGFDTSDGENGEASATTQASSAPADTENASETKGATAGGGVSGVNPAPSAPVTSSDTGSSASSPEASGSESGSSSSLPQTSESIGYAELAEGLGIMLLAMGAVLDRRRFLAFLK